MDNLHIPITGDNTGFVKALNDAREKVKSTASDIERSGVSIEDMFARIKQAAAISLAGFSAKEFIQNVVAVRGEFQQLEVAFKTMLGNAEKANELMQQLTKTAAATPFDLQGVTSGAKQLLAYGIAAEDVNSTLIHLGDIAAGLSLPLTDLVYLYGTTMVQGRMFTQDLRQFQNRGIPIAEELSKVLGVTKDKVGELVTAGKVGAKEFNQAIMAMSSEGGKFGGLMEAQSKTITGQISNIEDAIDVMFNNIGQQSEGIINGTLSVVSSLVENYEKVGKIIASTIAVYGTYKAAVMAVCAVQSLQVAGIGALTTAEKVHYGWLVLCQKAQLLLNKTMLANPYVLVATAIAGVAVALWNMKSKQEMVQEATEEYNKKKDEAIRKEEEHASKIRELTNIAGDESLSTENRREALIRLEQQYPSVFEKYDTEAEKLEHIRDIKNEIAILDGKKSIKNAKNELSDVNQQIKDLEDALNSRKTGNAGKYEDKFIGTHSSVLQARLTSLKNTRDALNRRVKREEADSYLANLTGISNDELQRQIDERRNLLAQITMREQQVSDELKGKVKGKVKYGGATGTYTAEELQGQLQIMQSEMNKRNEAKVTPAQQKKALKDSWEKAKKALAEFDKSSTQYTAAEAEAARKKLEEAVQEAEKKYKAFGGSVTADKSAAQKSKETERANARLKELQDKQALEDARDAKDMEFSTTQARIDAMQDGAQKTVSQIELDFKKQEATIRRGYEDLKQKKIDKARQLWEANPANKNKDFFKSEAYIEAQKPDRIQLGKGDAALVAIQEQEKRILSELGKGEIFNALQEQFGKGNVDVLARPLVDAAELAKKAWEDVGDGYATVFSSQYGITDKAGKVREILVTPILPDGSVLSKEELENYLHDKLEGAEDLMSADSLGIVIAVDVDKDGSAGEKLHELQEQLYDIPVEKTIQIKTLYDDATNVGLVNLNAQLEANEKAYKESLKKFQIEDTQYQIEYLKQYGTFKEQEAAIAAEYDAKIAEESNDWAKKSLEEQKKQALSELELTRVKFNIDWGSVFGNLANKSIKELERIKAELETLSNSGEITDIQQIRELQDAIARLADEFVSRKGGFVALRDSFKELKDASVDVNIAEAKIAKAREEGNAVAEKAAEKELLLARERKTAAEKSVEASKKAAAKVITTISEMDFTSFGGVFRGLKDLSPTIDSVFKTNISGIFRELGDDLTDALATLGDKIASITASLIELFRSEDHAIERELAAFDSLEDSINSLVEELSKGTIEETLDKYELLMSSLEKQTADAGTTLRDAMAEWKGGCTASYNHRAVNKFLEDRLGAGDYNLINNLLGTNISTPSELWYLTPKQLAEIKASLGSVWQKITAAIGDVSENASSSEDDENALKALENYLSIAGKKEEYELTISTILTGTTPDELKSSFKSALNDMKKDASDFGEDVSEIISESLLNIELNKSGGVNKLLDNWYAALRSVVEQKNNGELTDKEFKDKIEELKGQWAYITQKGIEARDLANEIAGVSTDKYEQDVSSGGWQSMGQDTADELNGRFTALQICGEAISANIVSMLETLNSISDTESGRNEVIEEIRNMIQAANGHLEDVAKYSKKIYNEFGERLERIETNTNRL